MNEPFPEDTIDIIYSYKFENGTVKLFNVSLNKKNLSFIPEGNHNPPLWTLLSNNKCANCTLKEEINKYCPVALNLTSIVDEFKEYFSYERVSVTVTTEERTYSKDTTLQAGLSSLLGIVMVTSGCPVMEYLKPMVRFHLPFAVIEETIFRMASMYLMSQYFLKQNGKAADMELNGLKKIYTEVNQVNIDFARRLTEAAKKDANVNALVNLNCFAIMIPLTVEKKLKELENYFSVYLK
jgi:hypothetical protein